MTICSVKMQIFMLTKHQALSFVPGTVLSRAHRARRQWVCEGTGASLKKTGDWTVGSGVVLAGYSHEARVLMPRALCSEP